MIIDGVCPVGGSSSLFSSYLFFSLLADTAEPRRRSQESQESQTFADIRRRSQDQKSAGLLSMTVATGAKEIG
jgi:hypothetical protein